MSDFEPEHIVTLGPLRHACQQTGACCHALVRLDDEEHDRIITEGAALHIERPVVDGTLRREDTGACVFLSEANLCRIHEHSGFEAKPRRCRVFPVKRIRTEHEERAGTDPACVSSHRTWLDGPVLDPEGPLQGESELSQHDVRIESMLITLARKPGSTVATLLTVLAGGHPRPLIKRLPRGFARRLLLRSRVVDLEGFLDEVPTAIRDRLAHLVPFLESADPQKPPSWPVLTREQEEFALNVLRRSLFLRFAAGSPASQGLGLLILSGAVLLAWADPSPKAFGEGLAAWARAVRYKALWNRFFPEVDVLIWLATGRTFDGDPAETPEITGPHPNESPM